MRIKTTKKNESEFEELSEHKASYNKSENCLGLASKQTEITSKVCLKENVEENVCID